eukprot:gene364-684_t
MGTIQRPLNDRLAALGLKVPDILLPKSNVAMKKWATIACDQYTADRDYWTDVERIVGGSPSTLRLMMPEVYLNDSDEHQEARKADIKSCMDFYGQSVLDKPLNAPLLVKRTALGRTRHGLMMAIDLEEYDFKVGSSSKVRATEKTIEARLPPRVAIREEATFELPHILVLVDDPEKSIIEPLVKKAQDGVLKAKYNFDLMKNGGNLASWEVSEKDLEKVVTALEKNYSKESFVKRYGDAAKDKAPMLFGVGDGNHSLASAKAFWEKMKSKGASADHPARYAMVEINNVHDDGLIFEPIHRLVFNVGADHLVGYMLEFWNDAGEEADIFSDESKVPKDTNGHTILYKILGVTKYIFVKKPSRVLPVATLQAALDYAMTKLENSPKAEIDFIHGTDAIDKHCEERNDDCTINEGFIVPGMDKNDLFKTVVFDGVLPRKTFSMGEADEKRFYCELRKIT